MCVWHPQIKSRHGITLMEVLIAIGILSIGLTSVAALLPAGGSQARKAIISDRAANLAENALADAITIGLTNPAKFSTPAPRTIVDPVSVISLVEPLAIGLFAQGRDDIIFAPPAEEDAIPKNLFLDGVRAFDGRTSCLWAIESLDGNPIAAGKLARLSAVIFQDRDRSATTVSASVSSTGEITVAPPAGRTIREILRTGTVFSFGAGIASDQSQFFSLRSASLNAAGTSAFGVFDRQPPAGTCDILLDSVGLAQTYVTLEGAGPFSSITPREVVP